MTEATKIFVYGTLLQSHNNYYTYLAPLQGKPGILAGAILRDLGGFPGLRFTEDTSKQVIGEVFEVDDVRLKSIDRLEGYSPTGRSNMYNRVEATLEDGTEVFVYEWNYDDNSPIISSGDWRKRNKVE